MGGKTENHRNMHEQREMGKQRQKNTETVKRRKGRDK